MKKIIWLTIIILVFFGILFLVNILYPGVISSVISIFPFDGTQWNLILAGIEIFDGLLIAWLKYWNENEERKKCQYKFEIAPESLRFNDFYAFDPINANSYTYVYTSASQEIEAPYYTINVPLTEEHCASVNIPFVLTVQRCPDGDKIEINDVFVNVENNGKPILKKRATNLHCVIGSNVTNGIKYLLRISLLCSFEKEQPLLNSRYIISLRLNFHDWRNQKITKFVAIEIQSVYNKKIIKQIVSHNSYLRHILWWLRR